MEHRCCVLGCLKTLDDGVKFHEFPLDNHSSLPIWIMATNRPDWLPVDKSRICNLHFSSDDYEDGDKNNALKPNACPTINISEDATEDSKLISSSCSSDISSMSDSNYSDIDSDDLLDTSDTSDMKFSDDDDDSLSDYSNSNEAPGLNNNFILSLSSESELDITNGDDDNNLTCELDAVSLSSSITSFENNNKAINQNCAVVLCNEKARNQFDTLFFINFPNDNTALCDTWWSLCGRENKYDPSFKICSIHFNADDFTSTIVSRDGRLYRQTILKNSDIVPTLFLLPHEYTKFTRKRKKSICHENKSKIQKKSIENERCIISSCNKTFSSDRKSTLFFKLPLENKSLLLKWKDCIELSDWQPLETDRICSDHFESDYVKECNNVYDLDENAIPSIKPKNPFALKSAENPDRKYKNADKNQRIKYNFSHIGFKCLNEDELMVEEQKIDSDEEEQNFLSDSKLFEKMPKIATTLSDLTEKNSMNDTIIDADNVDELHSKYNCTKDETKNMGKHLKSVEKNISGDKETVIENSNNSNIDMEYVYLDIFDGENDKIRPINNIDDDLKSEISEIKFGFNTKENNLKDVSLDVSSVTTFSNGVSSEKSTSKLTHKKPSTPPDNNILEETIMIPKSKNNGNYRDYIYLDMLDGNDVGHFLSLEKKYTTKKLKTKIPKLTDIHCSKVGISQSLICNQNLTDCYGEMLPPYCNSDCQLICYYSIPGPQRREIYGEFQKLQDATEQNCEIVQLVQLRMVKNSDGTFDSCPLYHLMMNKKLVKVCRTFFLNTLGITEHRIDAVLKPMNYSWFSDRDTALKSNQPKQSKVISEPIAMTNFVKSSLTLLEKDYNLYEPESDTEVNMDNVSYSDYAQVFMYIKSIPRILSSYQIPGNLKKQYFETTICLDSIYKIYSENFIKTNQPPPFTKSQFKKIYNKYMKTFLNLI